MASELRVNTLKDASGNNSIGMSYVAEGSCKSWVSVNGVGSAGSTLMNDSFNVSSDTDNGPGTYTFAFSTNMNNANYAASSGVANTTDAGSYNPCGIVDRATSSYRMDIEDNTSSQSDSGVSDATIFGDLA